MSERLRGQRSDDGGSALVMALLFLMLFGVLIGMILQFGYTSLKAGSATRDEATLTYAANGAAEGAVNALRADPYLGIDPGTTPMPSSTCFTLPASALDNATALTATCTPGSGSGAAPANVIASQPAHALLTTTTNSSEGVVLTSGASVPHKGDIRASRSLTVPAGSSLTSTTYISGQTCSVTGTVAPTPSCGVAAPAAATYASPVTTYPTVVSTLPTCTAGVVAFSPGTYLSRTALQNLINTCSGAVFWFRPGLYYFDFRDTSSHVWTISTTGSSVIVGGAPNGWTATSTLATVTARFPTAAQPARNACDTTAQGVEFIFGNDSGMDVQAGRVQLCAYGTSATEQHIAVRGNTSTASLTGTGVATSTTAEYVAATNPVWGNDPATCATVTAVHCAATVDGRLATVKIPNTNAGPRSVDLTAFNFDSVIPPEAASGTGTVTITATSHQRVTGSGRMDVTFIPGNGSSSTTVTSKVCPQSPKCAETAVAAATAPAFTVPYAALAGAKMQYTVTNTDTAPIEIWLDGVTLSVAYTASMRETAGSATTQPYVTGTHNAVLKGSGAWPTAQLAIRGTVYAPLGVIDLALTGVPHEVVDRGVIARHARLAMTAATSSTQPLISIPQLDLDPRYVYIVVRDGSSKVVLRAEARFANSTGAINGSVPSVRAWSHQ